MEKKLSNENLTRIQQTPPDSLFFIFEDYHQIYLESYEEKIKEKISIVNKVTEKPATLSFFALSSFLDMLGFKDYVITPLNKRTEIFDVALNWFFKILTVIVFFEIGRKWEVSQSRQK